MTKWWWKLGPAGFIFFTAIRSAIWGRSSLEVVFRLLSALLLAQLAFADKDLAGEKEQRRLCIFFLVVAVAFMVPVAIFG